MTYHPTAKEKPPRPTLRIVPDTRHARASLDEKDSRRHMAICGQGYPWPSTISLEPSRPMLQTYPGRAVTHLVTCRACVEAIENRRVIPFPIPPNSSDH